MTTRERATAHSRRLQSDSGAPFTVRRVILPDFDRREVLCDLGRAGTGWVSIDGFPISSPVWRNLVNDDEAFTALARTFRMMGRRERR